MDPIPIKIMKFQASLKHKRHLKHQPLMTNLFCYCLAALTCCLVCSTPLWFPSFLSSMKCLVQMMSSFFLSSKFVFILGNLIVLALLGESKLFSAVTSASNIHVEYEENIKRCQRFQPSSSLYKEKVNSDVEQRVPLKMSSCGDGDQTTEGEELKEQSEGLVVDDEVEENIDDEDEDEDLSLQEDHHFNKRADDFIARVNERRRFELLLCNGV